jgi:hypothetical protein
LHAEQHWDERAPMLSLVLRSGTMTYHRRNTRRKDVDE